MPKQLALEDVLTQRGAVESHEGLVLPRAVLVNGLGDELLAGAGLPLNQERGIGGGDPLQPLDQADHLWARSDDPLKAELLVESLVELEVLPLQPHPLARPVDGRAEVGEIEWLLEVGEGALLHGRDRRGDGAMAGDDDHLCLGGGLLRPGEDFQAADVVHHQVGDDDIERFLLDLPRPLGAATDD